MAIATFPVGAHADPAADAAECLQGSFPIRVEVCDVRSNEGTITADLHDDVPDHFLKKGMKVLRVRVPATSGCTEMCIPAPAAGVYAIALYQDRNINERLDQDFIGLPIEPYGISNNPRIFLSPPSHEEAAFRVEEGGTDLRIKLRN